MKRKFWVPLIFLLPVAFLLPYLGQYILPPDSIYSDLLISHLPNADFIRESITRWGQIPLWSPAILSGYPFFADPLAGLWYPPGWLAILLPAPFGFNLPILLHLVWGGFGVFMILKEEKLDSGAAIFGAMIFTSLPKLIAHLAAGHVSLLYAVSWTPWLLYSIRRYAWHGDSWLMKLGPGIILGVIALADVRWVLPCGLLWLAYTIWQIKLAGQVQTGSIHEKNHPKVDNFWTKVFRNIGLMGLQGVLALMVAAPILLPLLQFMQLSTRAHLSASEAFNLSLPLTNLMGLFFPNPGTNVEWVLYSGAITIVLWIVILSTSSLRRKNIFWLCVGLITLIFSLGASIPYLELIGKLPGFNLLRVPPRMIFITGLALAFLGGEAAHWLGRESSLITSPTRSRIQLSLVSFGFIGGLIPLGMLGLFAKIPTGLWWGGLFIVLAVGYVILILHGFIPVKIIFPGLILLLLIDVGWVNWSTISPVKNAPIQPGVMAAADFLENEPGIFRVYSPSYSIPQEIGVQHHLELADGIDPLQLNKYWTFMLQATGVPSHGYSVTLPSFAEGNPEVDNQDYVPNSAKLGELNIKYIVADYDLTTTGLNLVFQKEGIRIYENSKVLDRAWVQMDGNSLQNGPQAAAITYWSPNQIRLVADGPGRLVLSEIDYPGWEVTVDGKPGAIIPVDGLLRGVDLAAGPHTVIYTFQPWTLWIGLGLGGLAWIGIGWMIFLWRNQKRSRKPANIPG